MHLQVEMSPTPLFVPMALDIALATRVPIYRAAIILFGQLQSPGLVYIVCLPVAVKVLGLGPPRAADIVLSLLSVVICMLAVR